MKRRSLLALLVAASGCNALLGIEAGEYDPPRDVQRDVPRDAPSGDDDDDVTPNDAGAGVVRPEVMDGGVAVLATDMAIDAITVGATHVFWTNRRSRTISRAPIGGGETEAFVESTENSLGATIVAKDGAVYFLRAGVHRCPESACAATGPERVVPPPASIFTVAGPGATYARGSGLYHCPVLPCAGSDVQIAEGGARIIWSITSTSDEAVWASSVADGPLTIFARDLSRASPERVVSPPQDAGTLGVFALSVADAWLVFSTTDGLYQTQLGGAGPNHRLADGDIRSFVVRGGQIYYTDTTHGAVLVRPLETPSSPASVLAAEQPNAHALAIGPDRTLYWAVTDDAGSRLVRLVRQ
ncbi:MAG: hypothetical protein KIT84_18000 [Labilithrix sp.]|nr:hypothetical protein [Labilithrix sp.]MCW5812926.1 hypothetical protein [Labilithrix sp.]